MYLAKIFGAGSVGNHLAHACRTLGWNVVVCDIDQKALDRMKHEIFPGRYGKWDEAIQLYTTDRAQVGGFDLILVGTPPETHLALAIESVREMPKAIMVEKPACTPSLQHADQFYRMVQATCIKAFVGYDHVIGKATRKVEELIRAGVIGDVQTIDVEFREHWGGILRAHPWLKGPEDTYLGFWDLGGGASGEHSHSINLWQHFAHIFGAGRVVEVQAMLNYVRNEGMHYDSLSLLHLRTEKGLIGRVAQDVITLPPKKWARLQGTLGAIEWVNGYNSDGDAVVVRLSGKSDEVHFIPKKRPDDFIEEMKHIEAVLADSIDDSAISIERGLDTMLVVAAAHRSEQTNRRVQIDYRRGYRLDALQ